MLGLCLGGVLVAALLTAVGALIGVALPTDIRLWAAVALLSVLGVVELAGLADRLPQNRRLVPQTILAADTLSGPVQFGFEMGTGVRTYSVSALPLGVVVMALLSSPNIVEGLVMGLGFAAGRSLVHPARRADPERWDRRVFAARRPLAFILAAAFGLVAAQLLHA